MEGVIAFAADFIVATFEPLRIRRNTRKRRSDTGKQAGYLADETLSIAAGEPVAASVGILSAMQQHDAPEKTPLRRSHREPIVGGRAGFCSRLRRSERPDWPRPASWSSLRKGSRFSAHARQRLVAEEW